jgi:hypothetical protein
MRCPLQVASIMPAASAADCGIRILPGASDIIRSREPRRTTTVSENVTRYSGIGVAIFVVGSGICGKKDAHRSGQDPYFVCSGREASDFPRLRWVSESGMIVCQSRTYPPGSFAVAVGILSLELGQNPGLPRGVEGPMGSSGSTPGQVRLRAGPWQTAENDFG